MVSSTVARRRQSFSHELPYFALPLISTSFLGESIKHKKIPLPMLEMEKGAICEASSGKF
jgi:hypothetical protein